MTKLIPFIALSTPWRQYCYPSLQSLLTVLIVKSIVTVSCSPLPGGYHGNNLTGDNELKGQRSDDEMSMREGGGSSPNTKASLLLLNTRNNSDSDYARTLNSEVVEVSSSGINSNSRISSASGSIEKRVWKPSNSSNSGSLNGRSNLQGVQNNTSIRYIDSIAKRADNSVGLTDQNLTTGSDNGNLTFEELARNLNVSGSFNHTNQTLAVAKKDCMSEWNLGGSMYVIIMLSGLVCLAILFMLCSLFHKAEAFKDSKSGSIEGGLLFDAKGAHLTTYDGHTAVPLL